jgi:RNA polymerase sigma factor (TIGR02999 family)
MPDPDPPRPAGDGAAELLPLVYEELRKLAAAKLARENPGQTLQATALVHEAYLRLAGDQRFDGRGHFFAAAAEAMRRILVDAARRKKAAKHGGDRGREGLDGVAAPIPDDELLAVDEALDRFVVEHPEKAEVVKLRYFVGLTIDQAAEVLGVAPATVKRRWDYAKAWLAKEVRGESVS